MIYDTFAQIYDTLMDKSLYQNWFQLSQQLIAGNLKGKRVLDVACGTGDLAVLYAQAGAEVVGLDLAPEMLTLAEQKAAAAHVPVTWIEGDMTKMSELALGKFDLITCFDDSICYLTNPQAVQQFLKQLAPLLKPAGQFCFDTHSFYQMDTVFQDFLYNDHQDDWAMQWQSFPGEWPHSVEHELLFFIWNEDKEAYDLTQEDHRERTFAPECYQAWCQQVGLNVTHFFADFDQQIAVGAHAHRWFFSGGLATC